MRYESLSKIFHFHQLSGKRCNWKLKSHFQLSLLFSICTVQHRHNFLITHWHCVSAINKLCHVYSLCCKSLFQYLRCLLSSYVDVKSITVNSYISCRFFMEFSRHYDFRVDYIRYRWKTFHYCYQLKHSPFCIILFYFLWYM